MCIPPRRTLRRSLTARIAGWVKGDPGGTFRPYDYITRAEAAAVVNRTMGRTLSSTDVSGIRYTDVPMNFWAYNDILIASGNQR